MTDPKMELGVMVQKASPDTIPQPNSRLEERATNCTGRAHSFLAPFFSFPFQNPGQLRFKTIEGG